MRNSRLLLVNSNLKYQIHKQINNRKMENVKNQFTQLCVWPTATLEGETKEQFEEAILKSFKVRVKYLCEIKTNPDTDKYGAQVPETGGRNDLFFFLHNDDAIYFAVPRLKLGIRWWEDVIKYNDSSEGLYPKEFIEQYPPTW
jgi:hypothetical protein